MKVETQRRRDAGMRSFRFLAFAFSFSAFALTTFAQSSATWQVVKYDLAVMLPTVETAREMTVRAKLDLKNVTARPAASLTLRISPNATVSAVSLNGNAAEINKFEEKLGNSSLQVVGLKMQPIASGGSLTAVVDYKIALKDNTGLSSISSAGSQLLPLSFWYPTPNKWYVPRGEDTAPVRVQVTAPGRTVIASGIEANGSFDQKLSTQPFFITGNWTAVNLSGVSVMMPSNAGAAEQKRAAELVELAAGAKTFYASLLGSAPDVPIRIVSAGRGAGFHSAGTILIDDAVFTRAKIDSTTALSISEAIAKLWIGEATTVTGDGYGIIREGLTRHMANLFLESKHGKEVADLERTRQRIAYAAISRSDAPLSQVAPLDEFYMIAVANKGAMLWRLLSKRIGQKTFFDTIVSNSRSGSLSLSELRSAFAANKDLLDQILDQNTETNLLAGLPQTLTPGETKIALRNIGTGDATVEVVANLDNGERMSAQVTVKAASFGEVIFRTPRKIVRVEIDQEKLYPQTDYSDDVAPRETTDTDLVLAVKRDFDKKAFASAEKTARAVLRYSPRFDDVRVLLARSLLAQNKLADAEKEFNAVRDEKLPTARSLAWAAVGLADVASRAGREADAVRYAVEAIKTDGDYDAGLAARNIRSQFNKPSPIEESIKAFFARFDQAAVSNRKAELDALVIPGEVSRFVGGISGGTTEWKSDLRYADIIDTDNVLVEAAMIVRLLNRDVETGTAVFKLTRVAGSWKLSGVEIFEVR